MQDDLPYTLKTVPVIPDSQDTASEAVENILWPDWCIMKNVLHIAGFQARMQTSI